MNAKYENERNIEFEMYFDINSEITSNNIMTAY